VAACSTWREGVLRLLDPPLVIAVGTLGLSLFLPHATLDTTVGRAFRPDGAEAPTTPVAGSRILLPLPHPSGQSRWLNDPARARLLDTALDRLRVLAAWADEPGTTSVHNDTPTGPARRRPPPRRSR
jgi:uracil-DNA glycosylase